MNTSEIKIKNAPLLPLSALRAALADGRLDTVLEALGGKGGAAAQRARCLALCDTFAATYGADRDAALFTVSGRSELSGNHTDHNHGRVVACSISLDMLGIAAPRADGVIRLSSAGFGEDVVDTAAYTKPDDSKKGTSASLIAGVCAGFCGSFCAEEIESHRDLCADAELALHPDLTAHFFDQFLGDCHTKAGALNTAGGCSSASCDDRSGVRGGGHRRRQDR